MYTRACVDKHAVTVPGVPGLLCDLRMGARVGGKYRIEEEIAVGGMGMVLRARHEQLGTPVAIKFLMPSFAKQPETRTRFLREARTAANLQSDHVCRVLDVGETDTGLPYFVMEF